MRDRILGQSTSLEAPTTTTLAFTGNNISAKGDFASRSLTVNINVLSADPENRTFEHPDPIAWTLAHRRKILRAFYTIMLVERDHVAQPPTRFKTWWRLIGQPLEIVSGIKFTDLFKAGETDDEETVGASALLFALRERFGEKQFTSTDVAQMLDWESAAPMTDYSMSSVERSEVQVNRVRIKQQAEVIRGALEEATGGRAFPPGPPSIIRVGHRLKALAGRTVAVDGSTMRLKAWNDTHTKSNAFAIEVL